MFLDKREDRCPSGEAAVEGRRTSRRRSIRSGVSKMDSSSRRQRRESWCSASVRSARQSSGSLWKRSEPATSQMSSLSSPVRRSLSSSAWYPSGSSTQIPGVNLEEPGQQEPCGVCEMRPCSRLNLREIALTDRRIHLFGNEANQLTLADCAVEAADIAFYFPQILQLVSKPHCITNCN